LGAKISGDNISIVNKPMNHITNGFIAKAYRVRVTGNIDQKLYSKDYVGLIPSLEDSKKPGPANPPLC
jgi:hypothetical protein